jgi:hypothetical protein
MVDDVPLVCATESPVESAKAAKVMRMRFIFFPFMEQVPPIALS